MLNRVQLRWVAVCVLFFSSALNYLDRAVLSALAPTLIKEFHINSQQFGYVVSSFSITYAICAPLMGLLIDRIGLTLGASLVVGAWSAVGMLTGLVQSFNGLLLCRAGLGIAEAGGIPATGKAAAIYLGPKDRAMGAGISQLGLTIGIVSAPLVASWMQSWYGWRSAFVVSGVLGFAWIPIWILAARRAEPLPVDAGEPSESAGRMMRDRRFLGLIAANILSMTIYSLWTVWTTHFLVTAYGLSQNEANLRYAWIPPNFATAGGLFGGWLAMRWIKRGTPVLDARLRIGFWCAIFVVVTAAAPAMPNAALATAAICVSFFFITCQSVNYYSMPIDMFGARHAAFGVAALTGAFGLMQAFLSPVIGRWCDEFGWQPVCSAVAFLPFLSWVVLRLAIRRP
jgi:ACS family hexuronate transporter-like MFS transporter